MSEFSDRRALKRKGLGCLERLGAGRIGLYVTGGHRRAGAVPAGGEVSTIDDPGFRCSESTGAEPSRAEPRPAALHGDANHY